MTPKEVIQHFLKTNELDGSSFSLQDYLFNEEEEFLDSKFFCNRELLSSLVFDANATRIQLGSCPTKINEKINLKPINAFVSTRSGLTRFFNFDSTNAANDLFKRELSIDENIYRRTVDYSIKYEANHFIFELEKTVNQTLITASRALFLTNIDRRKKNSNKHEKPNRIRTPYAVVGMQFDYESFLNTIRKPTFSTKPVRLYFLDDNGYVLFGYNAQNELLRDSSTEPSGLLFGEYDSELFEHLINQTVFRRIKIFDYQGICEQKKESDTESSCSPAVHPSLINSLLKSLFTIINESAFFVYFWLSALSAQIKAVHSLEDEVDDGYYVAPWPNRTKIVSCRKDFSFYELNKSALSKEPKLHDFKRQNGETDSFIIYKIPKTNLILVINGDEYDPIRKAYVPIVNFEKTKCDRDTFHRVPPYMYKGPVCFPNSDVSY